MKRIIMVGLALVIALAFSGLSIGAGWGHHHDNSLKVGAEQEYATIAAALAEAGSGDTIMIYQGTYNENINIENFAGLTIKSAPRNDVIIQPNSMLAWNVGDPQMDARLVAIRIVNNDDRPAV